MSWASIIHWHQVFLAACLTSKSYTDRKSTRLNSSHANISYAVFCLKKTQLDGFPQLGTVCPGIGGGDSHAIIVQQCCTIMISRFRGKLLYIFFERCSNPPDFLFPPSSL